MPTTLEAERQIESDFICDCEDWKRWACAGMTFFKEHEGRRFCVLHYPGQDKIEPFRIALNKKLEAQDFDFCGVWFPEAANFEKVHFSKEVNFPSAIFSADANFSSAIFSNRANFKEAKFQAIADFRDVKFSDSEDGENKYAEFEGAGFQVLALFRGASFKKATFRNATFEKTANFISATFNDADFSLAQFSSDVYFASTTFEKSADFHQAIFATQVKFKGETDRACFGDNSSLNLQHATMEKPERVSFHTLKLRPHWFINVDARKFEFVSVKWPEAPSLSQEVKSLLSLRESSPHRLLSIAYRRLAVNAEENHRYNEASDFRFGSMEASRLEKQKESIKKTWENSTYLILLWLYLVASGYSERVAQAILVFFLLLFVFFLAYKVADFTPPITQPPCAVQPIRKLGCGEAAVYTLEVAFLQKPEPKPLTNWGRLLVWSEIVLAPTQAALLALAIRRKFVH